ncbi:hypothetical protein E1B28_012360 [Marasmius oreades]|uniref:G-patch domain-containing protein n=1 Tax=Marasmius oreades TaxID=181124 RepID=A0A9P7RSC3_9AGAR|nr:uncharacterized protein E1B28_012360 [Marasmius oreades]KAG7088356.1 hypothetical protein E1B28_012360 [Marasmius oreades]
MATTAYTIYSHYDPSQRERLEYETGQIQETEEAVNADIWEVEAFKARTRAPPPRFVRATIDHDRNFTPEASISTTRTNEDGLSSWYRSLTRNSDENPKHKQAEERRNGNVKSTSLPSSSLLPEPLPINKIKEKSDKSDWFIQKALLQSQSETGSHQTVESSPSTLADILARDPPPRPASGDKFYPPVFLALGPSNKGYALLENKGWTEGETLGVDVVRSRVKKEKMGKHRNKEVVIRDIGDGEVKEVAEVIDLTFSDSEEEQEEDAEEGSSDQQNKALKSEPLDEDILQSFSSSITSTRTALITPLPTILKSDRLGIGLKAKTVGPYKASMKRVTHNGAALAAHLQRAEDARKRREKHGRGHRAFSRLYKEEQRRRAELQAYMNS